ncbi:bifunctional lysylphosphatidylglycerol flippase/synthetase MprF [Gilliamella sp. B2894]|uniref:bifunctional lysylphosphatidylglycerol flippase/synthetase MprF n=1 Tax=unclassified Gilliamella TaxID=2685620 RepID=UPI00226AFA9B|nr:MULTISPECIES: bifunctional lysylphosphatidylglycerol flippase/synthetase MprF [unclassified Gilliamella]MCX8655976.1 bifunctional lysylphosphatidylglycerol flippase/synthetase MprF [Gilliamella sp. B2894]MCX8693957.1 bifunctional lysylphosphatidylglycerol flippase/synthetase MprF [Gilliamella sp. B2881]MCX8695078.1 bifunctional lysylphosphatidylglycerol flippase/synthetase MprF [Gilliamella sp. B2828]
MKILARKVLPWQLIEYFTRYRQIITLLFGLSIFFIALILCWHLLKDINLCDLKNAVDNLSTIAILLACLSAIGSYLMLIGCEWCATRYAGVKLKPSVIMLGGICASAIGNAIGLSALSGGAIRCRLYFKQGLTTIDVARMSIFVTLSLGLTLPLLATIAALINIQNTMLALHLSQKNVVLISCGIICFYAGMLIFLYCNRLETKPNKDTQLFQLFHWSIRLPNLRLASHQFVITLIDTVLAGTILYFLVPVQPHFITFIMIYILALVAGVLSHIPGGVGIFEAVMLAAFSSEIGPASLTVALIIYRIIYILIPLVIASFLLLINESKHFFAMPEVKETETGIAAIIMAAAVFFAGMVMMFSSVLPGFNHHLVSTFIPNKIINTAHLVASLIGVLCVLLAVGVRRRLYSAWAASIILLFLGSICSLLRGLHWIEASTLFTIAMLLIHFRHAFYRKSRLNVLPFPFKSFAVCFCLIAVLVWLILFIYQDVPYSHSLWWQFELDTRVPRVLRATLGSFILLICIMLYWLFHPALPILNSPKREELTKAHQIILNSAQPEGGLAMTGDKSLLFNESHTAFIMYAKRGRSMVALYDPIGDNTDRADLIWDFRDLCDAHHLRPVFYQVKATNLPFYMDIGLRTIKLGEEALVNLEKFDLSSKGYKDLRYTWNRCQRDGLGLEFYAPGSAPLDELKVVSDSWLKSKHSKEKQFSLGSFSKSYLDNFTIAAIKFEGRIIAFVNLLETNQHYSASIDLMRFAENIPKLTMEFLMIGLILHYKEKGFEYFSLGMVPLSGMQRRRGAPLIQRFGALVFRRGGRFYNFQGLRRFKDKFATHWEPRYMAVPAGLDPFVALIDTTMLISGGLTGLKKKKS